MCVCVSGGKKGGHYKIYVAFTTELVVKCNYRGSQTHFGSTSQQADWQEGRRRVIMVYSSSLSLCLSFLLPISLSCLCLFFQQPQTH